MNTTGGRAGSYAPPTEGQVCPYNNHPHPRPRPRPHGAYILIIVTSFPQRGGDRGTEDQAVRHQDGGGEAAHGEEGRGDRAHCA